VAGANGLYGLGEKMHELSIAESIITAVVQEMEEQSLSSVSVIGVRIGAVSGVLPDALLFSYEVAIGGTALSDTKLEIEKVPAEGKCRHCEAHVRLGDCSFLCPKCGSGAVDLRSGHELEVAYIEAERSCEGESDDEVES